MAEICVLGGAGHIGLPLSLLFAERGLKTLIYDINTKTLETIACGKMPFLENGGEDLLKRALASGNLELTSDIKRLAGVKNIVITIGTPVDEFLNPETKLILECADSLAPILTDDQTLILRSTVSPGTTQWFDQYLRSKGKRPKIAFCPERVVQGHSVREIQILPQIVSGQTQAAEDAAAELFSKLTKNIVRLKPMEAEFAKLFSNTYRYIQFAATNQFYMLCAQAGVDYSRVLEGMKKDYSRLKDLPGPGFAAGPCLFKDTMQLAAFSNNRFGLGVNAMLVNEGLPLFLVEQIRAQHPIQEMKIGLLGMAFKADSDDVRSSLSYKLKKTLKLYAKDVLTTDPFVTTDPELMPLDQVVRQSDLLILCAPHTQYRALTTGTKPVLDIWNFMGKGHA